MLFLELTTVLLPKGFLTCSFLCQVHSLTTEPQCWLHYFLCVFAYASFYRRSILLQLIIYDLILLSLSSLYLKLLDLVDTYIFIYYISPREDISSISTGLHFFCLFVWMFVCLFYCCPSHHHLRTQNSAWPNIWCSINIFWFQET